MRYTLTKAWDEAWKETRHIHLLGAGLAQTDAAKIVGRAMGELAKMHLPIKAVSCIAEAVTKAYDCGEHGSITGHDAPPQGT